jgi:parvulin-like peptidyl-prolyl isomerase
MRKNIDVRKIKIQTILIGLTIFFVVYLVVVSVFIYAFDSDNKIIVKTAEYIPYPIAEWGGMNFISINRLKDNLNSAKMFYENQDFSNLGIKIDFNSEDGKKKLKIKEKNVLNKLIENKLIENEARKRGITISSTVIAQNVSQKMKEYGSETFLKNNLLKLYGWNLSDFEENIVKPDMYRSALIANLNETDQANISAKNKISVALSELKSGKDFETVAKEYSEGGSASGGGDLGWISAKEMLYEMVSPVFAIKKGEYSGIIKSRLGYHIVKVEDRRVENGIDELKLQQIFIRTASFSDWLSAYEKNMNIHIFSRYFYWNKTDGQVEFKNNDLKNFEENLIKNSPGDISVLL